VTSTVLTSEGLYTTMQQQWPDRSWNTQLVHQNKPAHLHIIQMVWLPTSKQNLDGRRQYPPMISHTEFYSKDLLEVVITKSILKILNIDLGQGCINFSKQRINDKIGNQ